MSPRGPFVVFLVLLGGVLLGLMILPAMTASAWTAGPAGIASLPLALGAAWVVWFFAMWGALVAIIIATGAWLIGPIQATEAAKLEALRAGGGGD